MKILILEDDKMLLESLKELLEMEGFSIDSATTTQEVYDLTFDNRYDLYIFDINLNQVEDGLDVLKNLTTAGDTTPTFYITALSDIKTIQKAFDIGAEDFIKKPFDIQELLIRIKSRFLKKQQSLTFENISLNPFTKEVKKDNKVVPLGNVAVSLLQKFLQNQDRVILQEELLDVLENPNPNALRVNLAKLKKKLQIEFKNIRGIGYRLEKI